MSFPEPRHSKVSSMPSETTMRSVKSMLGDWLPWVAVSDTEAVMVCGCVGVRGCEGV